MKKALLIVVPLVLLLGGGAVGLAALGLVKVPFLPFGKKRLAKVPPDDGKGGPFASWLAMAKGYAAQQTSLDEAAKNVPPPPKPPPDASAGEAKLAALWAEMPPDKLAALTEKWPAAELGRILAQMDGDAVTELLSTLPVPRASALSRAVAAATDEKAEKVRAGAGI